MADEFEIPSNVTARINALLSGTRSQDIPFGMPLGDGSIYGYAGQSVPNYTSPTIGTIEPHPDRFANVGVKQPIGSVLGLPLGLQAGVGTSSSVLDQGKQETRRGTSVSPDVALQIGKLMLRGGLNYSDVDGETSLHPNFSAGVSDVPLFGGSLSGRASITPGQSLNAGLNYGYNIDPDTVIAALINHSRALNGTPGDWNFGVGLQHKFTGGLR